MPQVGNKKFPYTPEGIRRANKIRKQVAGGRIPPRGPNKARRPFPPFGLRPGGGRVPVGPGRRPLRPGNNTRYL